MDNKYLDFTLEYSLSSGYSLRLLTRLSRRDFIGPFTLFYLQHSGGHLDLYREAQKQFVDGEIFLLCLGDAIMGMLPLDNIGIRRGAQGHMAFRESVPSAIKREACQAAMDLMLAHYDNLIRIDLFFGTEREDIAKFVEAIGAVRVGLVKNGALNERGEPIDMQYYTYTGGL